MELKLNRLDPMVNGRRKEEAAGLRTPSQP